MARPETIAEVLDVLVGLPRNQRRIPPNGHFTAAETEELSAEVKIADSLRNALGNSCPLSFDQQQRAKQQFLDQAQEMTLALPGLPIASPFPGSLTQIFNFLKFSIRQSSIEKEIDYRPRHMQFHILKGLYTIVPDEIDRSGILYNRQRMKAVDSLLAYQLRLNDWIDFIWVGRPGLEKLASAAEQLVDEKKLALEQEVQQIPDRVYREGLARVIEGATKETLFIERDTRLKRYRLSFEDVERYRNLINAINICCVTAAIFGPEELETRLSTTTDKDFSLESIDKKYRWLFGEDYQNKIERAMMIMHNLAMAAQFSDDVYGESIDRFLNTPSLFAAALREFQGREKAKEFLRKVQDAYTRKARKLGLGLLSEKAFTFISEISQAINYCGLTSRNRFIKEQYLKLVKGRLVREEAFAKGELNY